MLTADLALSYQRGTKITPRYLDTNDSRYLQTAADLMLLVNQHVGKRHGELQQALDEYIGVGTDYKILRGLIKLLLDRCESGSTAVRDSAELRRALFLQAAAQHPILNEEARQQAVGNVAQELLCKPEEVLQGLYADLPDNQVLTFFEELDAVQLLDRYNLAQAQALLYRCTEMRIQIETQDAQTVRQVFNEIKAFRLIHAIRGNARAGYEVRLNGPVSLFHRSQRYGVQMAVFLPALLLHPGWQLRAEIETKRGKAFFELSSQQHKLRSHYVKEENRPENALLAKLIESWADGEWQLAENQAVLDLGETALVPDLIFQHAQGEKVYLEMLGYWTPRYLQDRLLALERSKLTNYLFVAVEELRCSREVPASLPANVIVCKTVLKAKDVAQRLARLTAG